MKSLESRISYLKGLCDGMDFTDIKKEQLINGIIDVLDDIAIAVSEVDETSYEIQEYLESIDEDLGQLEEDFYQDENDYFCDDIEENLKDDDFIETRCSNCNEIIYVDRSLLNKKGKTECPNCNASIVLD